MESPLRKYFGLQLELQHAGAQDLQRRVAWVAVVFLQQGVGLAVIIVNLIGAAASPHIGWCPQGW